VLRGPVVPPELFRGRSNRRGDARWALDKAQSLSIPHRENVMITRLLSKSSEPPSNVPNPAGLTTGLITPTPTITSWSKGQRLGIVAVVHTATTAANHAVFRRLNHIDRVRYD